MTVHRLTPEVLLQPTPYHHVAVGTGTRHVERVADEIGLPLPMPPASLIGVEMLFEATAVVDATTEPE